MGIGDVEFDATWENLEKALNEFNVKKDYINELKEIFYSVKDDIVIKKWLIHQIELRNLNTYI